MTPNFCKLLFGLMLSCTSTIAFSQNIKIDNNKVKTDTTTPGKKSSFKIGIHYSNNDVFMGRTDTVATPIATPNFKYSFRSGLYISGSLDFVTNRKNKKLDGGDFTL